MNAPAISCGLIGAGTIGRGIAASLLRAGHPLVAYDISEDGLAWIVAHGGSAASSPREVAAASRCVLLAVPDTPQILAALEGEDGLMAGLSPGSGVVIMSTVAPATAREVAARLAPIGVSLLDSPLSGGPDRAHAGTLTLMVGGDSAVFERYREVLEAIGEVIVHVGPTGAGELTKLTNNLLGAIIAAGLAEALTLAAKAGLDLERVREAIDGGSGANFILHEWLPRTVFADDYEPRFAIDLMVKDMGLIRAQADELDVSTPLLELAASAFEDAQAEGAGDRDFSYLIALHAQRAGVSLRSRPAPDDA